MNARWRARIVFFCKQRSVPEAQINDKWKTEGSEKQDVIRPAELNMMVVTNRAHLYSMSGFEPNRSLQEKEGIEGQFQ